MRTITLQGLLYKLGYDWQPDEKYVRDLCALSKCRTDPKQNVGFESCFLFLGLSHYMKPRSFVEIGTGRGTTSFMMAQRPFIEHVLTMDIVDFHQKRDTWCDFQSVHMSNSDIHDKMVERLGGTNCGIARYVGDSAEFHNIANIVPSVDLIYIDGSHDYSPVKNDITLSNKLAREDSIIVLDDYHPNYGVIHAVNEMIPPNERLLVEVNGHIFGPMPENGTGHVIWPRGKYRELLNESFSIR